MRPQRIRARSGRASGGHVSVDPLRQRGAHARDLRRPRRHELHALTVVATPLSATQPPTAGHPARGSAAGPCAS
eukprot:9469774-Alexandrium_andersonii.AAC.1